METRDTFLHRYGSIRTDELRKTSGFHRMVRSVNALNIAMAQGDPASGPETFFPARHGWHVATSAMRMDGHN